MTSKPGQQTIEIQLLSNISWSKDSQIMKVGQLREYKKANTFFQKLCRKWGREASSRPLSIL